MKRRLIMLASTVVAMAAMTATPALATHPHHLELSNGNCADRNGQGFGIGQKHHDNSADPGDTSFHERIHKGTPGTFAFEQDNNPVSVDGGLC